MADEESFGVDPAKGSIQKKNNAYMKIFYLAVGLGNPWAGHVRLCGSLDFTVNDPRWAEVDENFGIDDPIGSDKTVFLITYCNIMDGHIDWVYKSNQDCWCL